MKTLRESMFIPTPVVVIRCDNSAAKVLATGEGSWKTKSTANKVARVKEQVELLKMVDVELCGTRSARGLTDKILTRWTGTKNERWTIYRWRILSRHKELN